MVSRHGIYAHRVARHSLVSPWSGVISTREARMRRYIPDDTLSIAPAIPVGDPGAAIPGPIQPPGDPTAPTTPPVVPHRPRVLTIGGRIFQVPVAGGGQEVLLVEDDD